MPGAYVSAVAAGDFAALTHRFRPSSEGLFVFGLMVCAMGSRGLALGLTRLPYRIRRLFTVGMGGGVGDYLVPIRGTGREWPGVAGSGEPTVVERRRGIPRRPAGCHGVAMKGAQQNIIPYGLEG